MQLRNRLLQLWLENPRQQLVASDAVGRLAPPWDSDKQLGNTTQPRLHRFHNRLYNHGEGPY